MGKRITQQRRGKGSPTYRVRKRAFSIRLSYPIKEGKAIVLKLINAIGYTSPIALIKINKETFFNIAIEGLCENQEIEIGSETAAG